MSSSDPNQPTQPQSPDTPPQPGQPGQPTVPSNAPYPGYPPSVPYPPYPDYPAGPSSPYSYYAPPPGYGHNYIPIAYPTPYNPPMPKSPRSRSNKTLATVLIVVAAVVLIGCAAGTVLVISVFNAASDFVAPIAAVTQFCQDEQNQDYTAAYQLLSSNVRQTYSEDQFITFSQSRDSTDGTVTACQVVSGNTPQISGSTATLSLTDTLNAGQVVGPVTLVKVNGKWYLDSADSSLRLF